MAEPAGAPDPRSRKMRVLTSRYLLRAASELLVRNVNDSCWMLAFDSAASQAIVRGQIISAMEVLTFLVTPVLTAASDTVGRKPVLVLCALLNLGYQLCGLFLGVGGSVAGLAAGQFFYSMSNQVQVFQRAAMGDLYLQEPAEYAKALSTSELCYPLSKMVAPLFGAFLLRQAAGNMRVVYWVGTALAAADTLISVLGPETLAAEDRKPFKITQTHPLSFVKIFTAGKKLRRLAIVQLLGDASDSGWGTIPAEQVATIHRSSALGWSVAQRAQWDSITGLIRVLSTPSVSWCVARFGQLNTWLIGMWAYVLHIVPMALMPSVAAGQASLPLSDWHVLAALPTHGPIMHRVSVERVMVASAGVEAGFAQGELLGMSANLKTMAHVLAPLLWSRVYAFGVRRSATGTGAAVAFPFYVGVMLMTVARMAIAGTLAAEFGQLPEGARGQR